MSVEGSRVGIVGGSIAGCAAAIALRRAGCDVTVYERSSGELRDRGFGIAIPAPLHEELVAAGYLSAEMPTRIVAEITLVVRDGSDPVGREAWRRPVDGLYNNWAVLWQTLRARIPDENYRQAAKIAAIDMGAAGATVVTADGRRDRFDLVVGADGYRSIVREMVDPAAAPSYAGYGLWRGTFAESRLLDAAPPQLDRGGASVVFPGGHSAFYFIPDRGGAGRLMNWAIYSAIPQWRNLENPSLLPPGSVDEDLAAVLEELLAAHFPTRWADIVRRTTRSELSLQPIYDATVSSYVSDRLLLIGDAGSVPRPHSAVGAAKALQDALALERVCREHEGFDQALAAYDAYRCADGNASVELGRRLGRAMVEETPAWDSMTPDDFRGWMSASVSGRHWLYNAS